jgi:hypothetical protein
MDPRLLALSDKAYRLYVSGLIYSNSQLSDGYVPRAVLAMIVPAFREAALKELTDAQLWMPKSPAGYSICDFTAHQLVKSELEKRRADKKRAAEARWHPERATGMRPLSTSRALEDAKQRVREA